MSKLSAEMAENETNNAEGQAPETSRGGRRFFTRRNALLAAGAALVLLLLGGLLAVILYRAGTLDSLIKAQFVDKMNYMGVDFTADVFRVTVSPLELELKNATFKNHKSGEKLGIIRDAHIGLTIENLFAWQLSRDIKVDSTEINGAEVWVNFDENGRSNFADLVQDERASNVNFKYDSMKFSLRDSVIHFGDLSRTISADANELQFFLEPESRDAADGVKRYKLDLTSANSNFTYQEHRLENISIKARAVADDTGADITELTIVTPIGQSQLNGRITDWKDPKYDLDIASSVDLTQASTIFPLGAALRGVGNFKGKVSGHGEDYKVDGQIDSEALSAEGVYLKGFNVAATVAGSNSSYEANGKAVAELLTFGDFRIDLPRMAGNVRGTGTDFRWVGELEAIAARAGKLSITGLFLRDSVAEYKDRRFSASTGNGRAQKFSIADTEFANLIASNVRFDRENGVTKITSPNARADSMRTPDYRLDGVTGRDLRVTDSKTETNVDVDGLTAKSATLKNNKASDLTADRFSLKDRPNGTTVTLDNLQARNVTASGTTITGAAAPKVTIEDDPARTLIYADRLRVARIEGGGAVLGSLNIAGVRLTIREGTVSGVSDDIDAGNVSIAKNKALTEGGTLNDVKIKKPVFVVEPSGRYRASADMSIGGGIVGSVPLGTAAAKVEVSDSKVQLQQINAIVMDGTITGDAVIAFASKQPSSINAEFTGLDLTKLAALQGGQVIPIEGTARGEVNVTFTRTDVNTMSGKMSADIDAATGDASRGKIPITGRLELNADNGLFHVVTGRLQTGKSSINAAGQFDIRTNDSDLDIALVSSDASEIDRIIRVSGISPETEKQLDTYQATFGGDLAFNVKVTGNFRDPDMAGSGRIGSVYLRGRELGSVSTDLALNRNGFFLTDGSLKGPSGKGSATFDVSVPKAGTNNISVVADLKGLDAANLIAALPLDLPESLRDFTGTASGRVDLSGLPDQMAGSVDLVSTSGTIAGQPFDGLSAKANFTGTRIDIEKGEIRIGTGYLSAMGHYERSSGEFDLDLTGKDVPVPLALSFLPKNSAIPTITGTADLTAKATGRFDEPGSYNFTFEGKGNDILVNDNAFGVVEFRGRTAGQVLTADLTATLAGRPQVINGSVDFRDPDLPFRVQTAFDQSPLAPFLALLPQLAGVTISGTGTGNVEFGGKLRGLDADGNRIFTTANLSGTARFSSLSLQIQDTPLTAQEPVAVDFSTREIEFVSARFAGGGSNLIISGKKALADDATNSLSIDGRINLALLNVFPQVSSSDSFFGGFADVAVRLAGPNASARLSGTATLQNAAVAAFIGSSRLSFDRLQGRILFASNQAQIESATGYLGGGKFDATGGILFGDDLKINSFRVALDGTNVTVPLPEDFITTGDAKIEFSGRRLNSNNLMVQIAGNIRARRSLYSKDIELSNVIGARREGSLSSGASSILAPRFDLTIEGRDALIVKNNIADLTASVSLRLTGTTENPQLSGRITANSGTIFFRKDRYIVQRGVLEFPPNTAIEPVISLQAESEIGGYQVFVNLSGSLTDTETLTANVRSSPALPSQDVISLITTGSLSNTEGGLPTFAQTGINTAAEVLTDSIINEPARKATDKLFGLNVFEIDPIITGQRLNPSARLTVGRQINNNLKVTYSTNLSQDQNQILALEYRLSNKLSVVAQYEQRSLTNVTRNRDNFSVEVRFRRRF